jgi:hypothetical protein
MKALKRDGFAALTHSDLLLPHISVYKVFQQSFVFLVGNGESDLDCSVQPLKCAKW